MKKFAITLTLLLSFCLLAAPQATKKNTSSFNFKEFDFIPQPKVKLPAKEIKQLIATYLKSNKSQQEKIARELITHGNDTIRYISQGDGE